MINVVAGAVVAADGRVLIADRPPGKQLAGHWEFPGGKLETGETPIHALARELREEIGITIRDPRPLMRVEHAYDFGKVLVHLWVVSRYSGEPKGLDGQRLRWCTLDELGKAELLIADRPLVRALKLPGQLTRMESDDYVVTDAPKAGDTRLQGALCTSQEECAAAASRAFDFLVMSCTIDPDELRSICESVDVPVFAVGLALEGAWKLGATGVSALGSKR